MGLNNQDEKYHQVGILGGGVMGLQLAVLAAGQGCRALLLSRQDPDQLRQQLDMQLLVETTMGRFVGVEQGSIAKRVVFTHELEDLKSSDVVIETVVEDIEIKKSLLAKISTLVDSNALIATNTSTLNITALATSVNHPERFLAMHFFNPPGKITLVEIAPTKSTSSATLERADEFAKYLGQVPQIVPDVPGFIVNRLLECMLNEAIQLVEQHGVEPEVVDKCMKLGANHAMGPLELADLIGLDVLHSSLNILNEETSAPKFEPSSLLIQLVREGKLGKKSGRGLYNYKKYTTG